MHTHGPILALLLTLIFAARPCFAGPVSGQIVDPDGRGVPGAVVLLTDGTSSSPAP